MGTIWLLGIFLLPIILLTLLRINGVFVYLGLCLGYVLSQYDSNNQIATKLAGTGVAHHLGGSNDIRLILLLIPATIVLIFMFKTASRGKFSINLIPAIAVGLLAAITVVPLLPLNTAVNVMNTSLWRDLVKYQGAVVALTSLVITVLFVLQRTKFNPLAKSFKGKHRKSKNHTV